MTFSLPSSSTQHLNMPPQLKSNVIFPFPSTSSIPMMPPSPSPVSPQRSPADRSSSPPEPAIWLTAEARERLGEKRTMAPAVRAAARRRNESPLPVPVAHVGKSSRSSRPPWSLRSLGRALPDIATALILLMLSTFSEVSSWKDDIS